MGFREKMRRIRNSLFGRRRRAPTVHPAAERVPLTPTIAVNEIDGGPAATQATSADQTSAQRTPSLSPSDRELRLFGLRYLSRALTRLERGILRLGYIRLRIDAFGLRTLWKRLLQCFIRPSDIQYESAEEDFESENTREQHLGLALDDLGVALVTAESTMVRWEWVSIIAELRAEIGRLYEMYGRRLPAADI